MAILRSPLCALKDTQYWDISDLIHAVRGRQDILRWWPASRAASWVHRLFDLLLLIREERPRNLALVQQLLYSSHLTAHTKLNTQYNNYIYPTLDSSNRCSLRSLIGLCWRFSYDRSNIFILYIVFVPSGITSVVYADKFCVFSSMLNHISKRECVWNMMLFFLKFMTLCTIQYFAAIIPLDYYYHHFQHTLYS